MGQKEFELIWRLDLNGLRGELKTNAWLSDKLQEIPHLGFDVSIVLILLMCIYNTSTVTTGFLRKVCKNEKGLFCKKVLTG